MSPHPSMQQRSADAKSWVCRDSFAWRNRSYAAVRIDSSIVGGLFIALLVVAPNFDQYDRSIALRHDDTLRGNDAMQVNSVETMSGRAHLAGGENDRDDAAHASVINPVWAVRCSRRRAHPPVGAADRASVRVAPEAPSGTLDGCRSRRCSSRVSTKAPRRTFLEYQFRRSRAHR